MSEKGVHIGFCGIDGSGKSSQIRLLHRWMKDNNFDVILYEDTRNFVSEVSTSIAMQHDKKLWGFEYLGIENYTIAMSFEMLRQNMMNILPYTRAGVSVISPRTVFDHLARTKVRGCSEEVYKIAEEVVLFQGCPDMTIWIDVAPMTAYQRIQKRGYDFSGLEFLEKFRSAFLEISSKSNLVIIDGSGDVVNIHQKIIQVASLILSK